MYPIEIYFLVAIVDILLTLYAETMSGLVDFWKDITAQLIATFLTFYLASVSISGTVTYNGTALLQDDGLMWILIIAGVVQSIYMLISIIEAYEEYKSGKEERLLS